MVATDAKQIAVDIFMRTLSAIDVETVFHQRIRLEGDVLTFDGDQPVALHGFDRILMVGIGKASLSMGHALESILGSRITGGVLVTNSGQGPKVRAEVLIGSHPTPDCRSIAAGNKVMDLVRSADQRSLIVFLISGGGSSLLEVPLLPEVTAADLAQLNQILVTSRAPIHEINVVRKHLSSVKGGRLGTLANGAKVVAIFISDVNHGDLTSISSNPVLPDDATLDEFYEIVDRYQLRSLLPGPYARAIRSGSIPGLPESACDATTFLLSDNSEAQWAAEKIATDAGFRTFTFDGLVEGDYRQIADSMIGSFARMQDEQGAAPLCAISGGEVVCPVTGAGRGGRNQEFVLYSAAQLDRLGRSAVILSCGTDGIDGNSPAAGAVADGRTIEQARSLGLDYRDFLANNDSFSFFQKIGGSIVTGPTGNNVRDIRLMLCNADRLT